jgi:hypothetical protein
MLALIAILSAPVLQTPMCPETIRMSEFTEIDVRNTKNLHAACARRHGGDVNWCAYKITKKGEGNYHVICKDLKDIPGLPK